MTADPRRAQPGSAHTGRGRVAVLSSVHNALDPRVFHKQARTLAAAGFDVHLIARHDRDEQRAGVHIHALPAPRSRWRRPAQWARLAWRTWRLRPRLIHIHDPELLPLLLVLRPLLGAAAVYDAHEYYADEVSRRAWIPAPLRRPAARITHAVETFAARRIDAVVAVNEHMAARFRRRGARAVAVHNFPPGEYVGVERPRPGVGATIVYLGLLSSDRGLATVFEAARRLHATKRGARVRVIGRVDWDGLPASLPRDLSAWREAGVEFAGTIPADDVPLTLAQMSIGWIPFLETPNNRRTIPLKLLEYMAAGLPVVVSDLGFMAGIVRESGCGLLAPPGDAVAHAAALAELLTDPQRAMRMGEAGRAAVRERYTWAAEGRKLVTLYETLLGIQGSAASGSASQSA
jgi:glycosyltransferase involved in cell wall biosynthesis